MTMEETAMIEEEIERGDEEIEWEAMAEDELPFEIPRD